MPDRAIGRAGRAPGIVATAETADWATFWDEALSALVARIEGADPEGALRINLSRGMAMTIVIHGVPGSPYVRMPMLACEEKQAAWRLQPLRPDQIKAPEHLARHPFGRVPAIEHGDFQLYECQAILRYIDAAFDGPSLTPSEPKALARMSQVLNILDWYAMPSITGVIAFNRVVKPMLGLPVDEAAVAAAVPLAQTTLKALEALLGSQDYFAGPDVSLADLAAVAHLDMAPATPEGRQMLSGSPLLAWLDRMNARPSVQATSLEKTMGGRG